MDRQRLNLLVHEEETRNCDKAGQLMDEASLNRINKHFKTSGFGIVTAYRTDNSLKQNKANQKTLENAIRSAGFGFIRVQGVWDEKLGKGPESEPALFIPAKIKGGGVDSVGLRELVIKQGIKYNQDAVVWGGLEGKVELIATHTNFGPVRKVVMRWDKLIPKAIGQMYSRLKKGASPERVKAKQKNNPHRRGLAKANREWTMGEESEFIGWYFSKPPESYMEALVRRAMGESLFILLDTDED